jgi:hypothetical protein
MTKPSGHSVFFLAGILFSLSMVIALPEFYFQIDMESFWLWSQHWNAGWREIYISCAECNYPIIGMLSTAGLIGMLRNLGYEKAVFVFRFFLGLVDGLNVILIFWLLKKMSVKKAAFWAGMIGVSISVWGGGAFWGQIDGVSQFFLLAALAWMIKGNLEGWSSKTSFGIFVAISGILMAGLTLTKQLTLFSLFSLGLLLATNLLFFSRQWKALALNSALALGSFLVVIFGGDFFLKLPKTYFSHLVYIWKTGSNHSDVISGNGFNLWMFLGRDMWSSSHIPLFENVPFLTPYGVGMFLFIGFTGLITLSLFLFLREHFQCGETFLNQEVLLNFIFHLALVNLSFNVFLTGTHERYLYHFYPYILLAWAGLEGCSPLFSRQIRSVLISGASFYGIFILMILSRVDFKIGYLPHWTLGIFHLGLLIYLTVVILRYQKFTVNVVSLLALAKTPKNLPTVR